MTDLAIDTNVLIVANGDADHASPDCVEASIDKLLQVRGRHRVLLDASGFVLEEYMKKVSLAGAPGVGDAFLQWIWDHQADAEHCRTCDIEPLDASGTRFGRFPGDPELARFDPSDRKFVALVVAAGSSAKVVNAVDSDWAQHAAPLRRVGVRVEELCS